MAAAFGGGAPSARGRDKHASKSTSRHAEHLAEHAGLADMSVGGLAKFVLAQFRETPTATRGGRDLFHRLSRRLQELYPLEWRFDSPAMSSALGALLHAAAGGRSGRRGAREEARCARPPPPRARVARRPTAGAARARARSELVMLEAGAAHHARVAVRERGRLVSLAGLGARDVAGLALSVDAAAMSLDASIGACARERGRGARHRHTHARRGCADLLAHVIGAIFEHGGPADAEEYPHLSAPPLPPAAAARDAPTPLPFPSHARTTMFTVRGVRRRLAARARCASRARALRHVQGGRGRADHR